MLPPKVTSVILLLICLLVSVTSRAEDSECTIVYGKNWAFLFATPKNWNVACPVNDPSGVVVALWPEGMPWADAPGVMYVTVSEKDGFSLEQFAEDELARFRKQSPKLQAQVAESILLPNKTQALVRELTGDQYGNHEAIAYVNARTVYLIAVLSSRTEKDLKRFRPAFDEFISSISPMKIEFQDAAAPNPAFKLDAPKAARPLP